MTVAELAIEIQHHLQRIEKVLPKTYALTLVARYTGSDYKDADIVMTRDDLTKVQQAIERLKVRDPAFKQGDRA